MSNRIWIAPGLRGRVGILDLLGPEVTFFAAIEYAQLHPGEAFSVASPSFCLSLSFGERSITLTRNEQTLTAQLANAPEHTHFLFLVVWSPTLLKLEVTESGRPKQQHEKQTIATYPPNSLRNWARRENLIPSTNFASADDVFLLVVDQIQAIQEKITTTNAQSAFWNTEHSGNTITTRRPKRETEAHANLRLLLDDVTLRNGLQISPEHPVANGKLDFLISGNTSDGRLAQVCIEIKNAHSNDLLHGYETQLPLYMNHVSTDYGIYLILDYGANYPPIAKLAEVESEDVALRLLLSGPPPRDSLRIMKLSLQKGPSPSKA